MPDGAFGNALEQVLPAINYQCDDGVKTGLPVLLTRHFPKHQLHVCLGVPIAIGISLAGVAGGKDARLAAKCRYFESGVLRKAVDPIVFINKPGLLQRIFGDGRAGLRQVQWAADVGQAKYFKLPCKQDTAMDA